MLKYKQRLLESNKAIFLKQKIEQSLNMNMI